MVEHTRTLGFWVAFALGLGTMIAAGIFSLSGTAVAAIGSSAVIAFVIAALIAGITAASYSEFASIYAENGGGYLFSSRTFDRDLLEYAVGASLFLGYTGTTAFYLATMDEWFLEFVVPHGWPIPHGSIGVLAAVLLGALNAQGTEESGTFQVVVSGAKVAVLIAFIGGAFAYKAPSATIGTFTAEISTDIGGIISIAALAFITFFGFSAIAASAGEIIEPRKTVPRAIAASIVAVTILYAFVIIAMVNAPIPAEVIAKEGETAMGSVANAFLGSIGMALIVAGAIFSMISASNASVLAASSIGSLMGRQGQAPRRFSRIHPSYGTPFWSVVTVTGTIVALIVAFIMLFPAEGGIAGIGLGLEALTGFATFNLLAPLSVVNVALIVSRRRFPDIDRPLKVPLVPLLPIIGIAANIGLITSLPTIGVIVGTLLITALIGAYLIWGGAPETEELFERIVSPYSPDEMAAQSTVSGGGSTADTEPAEAASDDTSATENADRFQLLVPVRRPSRAPTYVQLAAMIGNLYASDPVVRVVTVTHIPDQTPSEVVVDTAEERASRIGDTLVETDIDADYTVEGQISRDVGFSIVQTARDKQVDLILMGYPEESADITQRVEFDAPCDVLFSNGFVRTEPGVPATVNVGAGGGPHHKALLPFVNELAADGSTINVINVSPTGEAGTAETPELALNAISATDSVEVQNVTADSVAEGLVTTAAENGGILVIGASRTRRLRQWIFGSTPDRVIDLAEDAGVPVIVYAGETTVRGLAEDLTFPLYRYFVKLRAPNHPISGRGQSGDVEG
ncbi:amino acid permease [Natrinema sp. 74]|uniref:amino acid permease n=1 Tax=Natrinema sp. 74 TaxID=3384159 RepID=UPI0038D4663A